MKKILLIAIVVLIIIASGLYFATHKRSENMQPATQNQTDILAWKTYQNTEFGFSIKYPSPYVVKEDVVATGTPWGSRSLLSIYDISNTSYTAASEFDPIAIHITLQRQPVLANGEIYHTVAEYQRSGAAAQMVQGAPNPNGELVMVNGVEALKYYFPPVDVVGVSTEAYFFIKNNLIYEVSLIADNPDGKAMLQSIAWH